MFKIGDKVRIKLDCHAYTFTTPGMVGTICLVGPGAITAEVDFKDSGYGIYSIAVDDLALCATTLPSGAAMHAQGSGSGLSSGAALQHKIDWHIEISKMIESPPSECDCGGFKTYNSMSPENHSDWCSSRKA